jgi:hypothetical protein
MPGEVSRRFASIAEREIRAAMEEGRFENLPGAGQPLPGIDEPYDPMWWVKKWVRRQKYSFTPAEWRLKLELERELEALPRLRTEAAVRQKLTELNARIRRANATNTRGPTTTLTPLPVESLLARWRRERAST